MYAAAEYAHRQTDPDNLKVYIHVLLYVDDMGRMIPRQLQWEDGRWYEIDKVLDIRPAPAAKAGGQGDRYTVRIRGQQRMIFFEHNPRTDEPIPGRWFIERRVP